MKRAICINDFVIEFKTTVPVENWPDDKRSGESDTRRLRFCKLQGMKLKHVSVIERAHGITLQELPDHPIMKSDVVFLPALPVVGEPQVNYGTVVQYLAIRYTMDGRVIHCAYGVVVETCNKRPEWIVMPLVFIQDFTTKDFLAMRCGAPLLDSTVSPTIYMRTVTQPYATQHGRIITPVIDPDEGTNFEVRGKTLWHRQLRKVLIGDQCLVCRFWDHEKDMVSALGLTTPNSRLWTFAARHAKKPTNIVMFSAFEVTKAWRITNQGFLLCWHDEDLVHLETLDAGSGDELEQATIKLLGHLAPKTHWSKMACTLLANMEGWGVEDSIDWGRHEVAAKDILAYPIVIWDTDGPRMEFIIKEKGTSLDLKFLAGACKIIRSA